MTRPEVAFPGATGLTVLDVYDWPCPDGLRGGSAHVHLASTEGYLVIGGEGRLQTLGAAGYREAGLRPGDCLWFTPGTVHRLVNDDGRLQILVVMQNAGLPEAGDAVLTFPPEVLADPARYAAAASLTGGAEAAGAAAEPAGAPGEPAGQDTGTGERAGQLTDAAAEAAARRRRDLAIEGYLALRAQVIEHGPAALDGFLAAAARLVGGRVPDWRSRWQQQAAAVAALTGQHLDGIEAGRPDHLRAGSLQRIGQPSGPRGYGMCGRLTTYPAHAATGDA
ncbi:MAG TPA: cupin domain-containing protein [Streptosporangiaceae bacterium]|nr:cupin domain-containing protein [Streptosporangiaceae bacterium]